MLSMTRLKWRMIIKRYLKTSLIGTALTTEQDQQVRELLLHHVSIFSKSDTDIGRCDKIKHRIDLIDERPFKQRHRRIPPSMVDEVRQHIKQLLACGIIRKSNSPWASNVVLRPVTYLF